MRQKGAQKEFSQCSSHQMRGNCFCHNYDTSHLLCFVVKRDDVHFLPRLYFRSHGRKKVHVERRRYSKVNSGQGSGGSHLELIRVSAFFACSQCPHAEDYSQSSKERSRQVICRSLTRSLSYHSSGILLTDRIAHQEGNDVDLIPWNAFCREKSVVNQREQRTQIEVNRP